MNTSKNEPENPDAKTKWNNEDNGVDRRNYHGDMK